MNKTNEPDKTHDKITKTSTKTIKNCFGNLNIVN